MGHQASTLDMLSRIEHRRQARRQRKRIDVCGIGSDQRAHA
jgi:hypothetical protein